MERRERIGHLLGDAEISVALAIRFFGDYGEQRMKETREHAKKARQKLKQALESIDGID